MEGISPRAAGGPGENVRRRVPDRRPGLLDDLTAEDVAVVRSRLRNHSFEAGTCLLSQGRPATELYLLESGTADVVLASPLGPPRVVGCVGAGETCGEMSVLTGEAASATVRERTRTRALAMTRADFAELVVTCPRLLNNVARIVADRLVRADARSAPDPEARVLWLVDHGAPPMLSLALACSIAWHTRQRTVLLVCDAERLADIARSADLDVPEAPHQLSRVGPHVALAGTTGDLGARGLTGMVHDLSRAGGSVLVLLPSPLASWVPQQADVELAAATAALPTGRTRTGLLVRGWGSAEVHAGSEHRVPPPQEADRRAVHAGALPLRTAMGRAVGNVARELTHLRVGMALGEGGARGFAHIGALRGLHDLSVPCDRIAGTSIGAAVAGLHAAGVHPDAAQDALEAVGSATFRPVLSRASLLSHSRVAQILRQTWASTLIQDLETPLAVVAADLVTGDEVVFRTGLLWAATLASITIPGVYPPQRMGNRLLVDGGVVDPVPVRVAKGLGADIVIAVRLSARPRPGVVEVESTRPEGKVPSVLHTLLRARDMQPGADAGDERTVVLEPTFPAITGLGLWDFAKGRRFVDTGQACIAAALPQLGARMPWLRDEGR